MDNSNSVYNAYVSAEYMMVDSSTVDLLSIGVSGLLLFIFIVLAFVFGEG